MKSQADFYELEMKNAMLEKENAELRESEQQWKILAKAGDAIVKELQASIDEMNKLIKLVVKDLRMRADEDGTINISNFIWELLIKQHNKDKP